MPVFNYDSYPCGHGRTVENSKPQGAGRSLVCRICSNSRKRRWEAAHPEKRGIWKREHSAEYKARVALWACNHAAQCNARKRKWEKDNPEKQRDVKAKARCRRRALSANAIGSYTPVEFRLLCARFGNRCLCCGKKTKLTADHVLPLSKGDSDTIDNLQPLCRSCNSKKSTKHIDYRNKPSHLCVSSVGVETNAGTPQQGIPKWNLQQRT